MAFCNKRLHGIHHAGGQAHYYSRTGTLCFNLVVLVIFLVLHLLVFVLILRMRI